jgi:hypothetical protein
MSWLCSLWAFALTVSEVRQGKLVYLKQGFFRRRKHRDTYRAKKSEAIQAPKFAVTPRLV